MVEVLSIPNRILDAITNNASILGTAAGYALPLKDVADQYYSGDLMASIIGEHEQFLENMHFPDLHEMVSALVSPTNTSRSSLFKGGLMMVLAGWGANMLNIHPLANKLGSLSQKFGGGMMGGSVASAFVYSMWHSNGKSSASKMVTPTAAMPMVTSAYGY